MRELCNLLHHWFNGEILEEMERQLLKVSDFKCVYKNDVGMHRAMLRAKTGDDQYHADWSIIQRILDEIKQRLLIIT